MNKESLIDTPSDILFSAMNKIDNSIYLRSSEIINILRKNIIKLFKKNNKIKTYTSQYNINHIIFKIRITIDKLGENKINITNNRNIFYINLQLRKREENLFILGKIVSPLMKYFLKYIKRCKFEPENKEMLSKINFLEQEILYGPNFENILEHLMMNEIISEIINIENKKEYRYFIKRFYYILKTKEINTDYRLLTFIK